MILKYSDINTNPNLLLVVQHFKINNRKQNKNTGHLFCAGQAEDVLAGDHPAVDENWLEALVAAVNHRIQHLKIKQNFCRCLGTVG